MGLDPNLSSRREFVGRLAIAMPLATGLELPRTDRRDTATAPTVPTPTGDWDLSWIDRLKPATDRAVFDWPTIGDPADPIVLEIAERYLDNCEAAYGKNGFRAGLVINIRTTATPAALADTVWERLWLGAEYNVIDPGTQQPARRNPFWRRASTGPTEYILPTLEELVERGAIVLVCDFALGHMSRRIGTKLGRPPEEVHRELRDALIPGAVAVPSGIFGLARSQNAGCAFVRM